MIFGNISEHKEVEQAFKDSKKHLSLATKAAEMHLCKIDLINETIEWTDEVEHNVNFPMPVTLNEARELLHPGDMDKIMSAFEYAIEQQKEFEVEYRIIDPTNNKKIWVYSAGAAIRDGSGDYTCIVGVTKNITERKYTEIRNRFLTKLGKKLRRIGNPDQIMNTTVRLLGEHLKVDRCTYAKVGADEDHLTILGSYTRDDIPAITKKYAMSDFGAKPLHTLRQNSPLVIDDIKKDHRIRDDVEAAYKQNKIRAYICIPLHKDGRFIAKMAVHQQKPRKWLDQEIELIKVVTNDCWEAIERARINHELQKMNETLEERIEKRTESLQIYQYQLRSLASELNKAEEYERQRLASELHNNLGQMLAIAKMKLDTLEKRDLPEGTGDEIADLTTLLNDALTYTRDLMSDLKPPPALYQKNIRKVLLWVAKKMKKHDLKVTVEGGHQKKYLNEKIQITLHRCVSELLFNIIKYAGVDEARIIISYNEKEIQVTVEDEGEGFSMGEEEPTPTEEGGFGLFNIRERMDWLGGKFKITTAPGEGTKAMLYIPLQEELQMKGLSDRNRKTASSSVSASEQTQTELWQKIKILLVDDHKMMRKGLRRLIEEQDDMKIIAETSNGEKAIKLVHETSPDVIVMDINLPGMDGIQATKKISSAKPDISVIGLSLYNRKEIAQDMKTAGASFYLTKTEAFGSLCATIRESVRRADKQSPSRP